MNTRPFIDTDKLNSAFKAMRKEGLIARQNYKCCGSCAGSQIATDVGAMAADKRAKVTGCVTYHHQANEVLRVTRYNRFAPPGNLYIGFGQISVYMGDEKPRMRVGFPTVNVGYIAVRCLRDAGLTVEWSGSPKAKIVVVPS